MADRNAEYQNLNQWKSLQSSFSFESSHKYANVEPALCFTGGQEAAIDTKHNEADGVKKDHGGNEDKQVSQEKTWEENHYYDIEEHIYEDAEEAACEGILYCTSFLLVYKILCLINISNIRPML